MKLLKWGGFTLLGYVCVVVLFESFIGFLQPSNAATLSLTVYEENDKPHVRVLSRIEHDNNLYVAVNHWPRSWYRTLQENPQIKVSYGDIDFSGTAVIVTDADEHNRIATDRPLPVWFKVLTGFPPRYFVRLEPS